MSSKNTNHFTKETLDNYLKELAKEYRRMNGKSMPAEIVLVGGAAVLANYGFRNMTTDVDAIIRASSSMKDAANRVGDKFDLPNGWFNADFTKTASYSPKLAQYCSYYKTFYGVLEVRTVAAEYLIAMKLRSGRKYKNDLSDIVGVLAEHEKRGAPITMENIKKAVVNLYGDWEALPVDSRAFIQDIMARGNFESMYSDLCSKEHEAKDLLISFEKEYPGVTNTQNVEDILSNLQKRSSLLEKIQAAKEKQAEQRDPQTVSKNEPSIE